MNNRHFVGSFLLLVLLPVFLVEIEAADKKTEEQRAVRAYYADAVKQAKLLAMDQIRQEIQTSQELKDVKDSSPFLKFARTKPYAKVVSKSAIVQNAAIKLIGKKLNMTTQKVLALLTQEQTKLLKPMPCQCRPNTPMPFPPDIDYCPYPERMICDDQSSLTTRTMDGSCNNLINTLIGRSMTPFRRLVPPRYEDGIGEPRLSITGSPLPGARNISIILSPDINRPSKQITMAFVFFGQLTDHDLSRSALTMITEYDIDGGIKIVTQVKCGDDGCQTGPGLESCLPIPIPSDDPDFNYSSGCLMFVRDMEVPPLNCQVGPGEHLNQVTHWLDGSQVYGSTKEDMDLLRDYSDPSRGRMAVATHPHGNQYKPLLPKEVEIPSMSSPCENVNNTDFCQQAGDNRVNENAGLNMWVVLLVRYHNFLEEQLHRLNPQWNGERVFQETRRIVISALQHITFNEFLPLMIGPNTIKKYKLDLLGKGYYKGYDPTLDSRIPNDFSGAAFRIGHSLLQEKLYRKNDSNHLNDNLFLSETFNRPDYMYDTDAGGVDGFIRGLIEEPSQSADPYFTKQVSGSLFTDKPPHGPGLDLPAINIQRGRDHGLGTYNDYREFCGLARAKNFEDLASEMDQQQITNIIKVYGSVEDIDIFPGGLSERSVAGGIAGPTFACIIANTFYNLRKADRFWYENKEAGFTPAQLNEIRKITMARIMCTNGDHIETIQPYVFQPPGNTTVVAQSVKKEQFNNPVQCQSLPDIDLNPWKNDQQTI